MQRKQKTATADYSCEGMLETESTKRVPSISFLESEEKNGTDLLEVILHRDNLNAAWKKVKGNKGAAGIDKMTVEDMLPYLKENKESLLESIRGGWYKPTSDRTHYGRDLFIVKLWVSTDAGH